ncbi:MAG: M28 family peptidase [Rhodobacteraceae bacterium]|nr:M28 family peptidase [Paracoccaceae bacterium]
MRLNRRAISTAVRGATFWAAAALSAFVDGGAEARSLLTAEPRARLDQVMVHMTALQRIADENGGNRAAGETGYLRSVDYVAERLIAAGYQVELQPFTFTRQDRLAPPEMEEVSPEADVLLPGDDFNLMSQSGEGAAEGPVVAVAPSLDFPALSISGCEPEHFTTFPKGAIALLQRGGCTFSTKATLAAEAGAAAVVVFNQGDSGRLGLFRGALGPEFDRLPVFTVGFELGARWARTSGLRLRMAANIARRRLETVNVIAETVGGREDAVVMAGAHLDSVIDGPGMVDNASGSAALLAIAEALAAAQAPRSAAPDKKEQADAGHDHGHTHSHDDQAKPEPAPVGPPPSLRNKIRFVWWGAEELGLIGSQHYVDQLTPGERDALAMYLNFDMIASPNPVRFVMDGDASHSRRRAPEGSEEIEALFHRYFDDRGLSYDTESLQLLSDYSPFLRAGVPVGGQGVVEKKTDR